MNLYEQLQHETNMANLTQAIADTVVEQVEPGLKVWTVMLDGKQVGSIKHEKSDAGGRLTDREVWQYNFQDKSYWGLAPSKKSAINSIVHRALFA